MGSIIDKFNGLVKKVGYTKTNEIEKMGFVKANEIGKIIGSYFTNIYGTATMPEKEYSQLVDAYKSWTYTAIDKIAKAVAMIPLRLYIYRRKGKKVADLSWRSAYKAADVEEKQYMLKQLNVEKEEITSHVLLNTFQRPNMFMTRFMLWYETIVRLELGGSCGWYLPANRLGIPVEIWPLPLTKSAKLRPKISADLQLEYWQYQDGDINRQFKPNDVLLIKYPHPASPFQGMSPLMAQTYPYDIDLFLMQQQRGLFANMAVPGFHLSTDQPLTKVQVDELKMLIDEQYGGANKAGRTLVTHSGLKAQPLAMSGRDLMLDEVARYAREKLLTAYDLSEGKLGLVRDVNRANMDALNVSFVTDCLKPKCMLIEEIVEAFLLPRYSEGLTCDFDLPDIADKEFKLRERESNLTTGKHTINEERARDGEEPVEWGDKPWLPFSLSQPGTEKKSKGIPEGEENEPSKQFKGLTPEFWTEEKKEIAWKQFIQRVDNYKDLIEEPMRHYFNNQKDAVTKRLIEEGKKIHGLYAGWSRGKVESHLAKNKPHDKINIDQQKEAEKLEYLMNPIVKNIMQAAGDARLSHLFELMKLTIGYNVNDPKSLKWLGKRMRMFSQQVTGTTFNEISAILRDGFTDGQPVATIAETLAAKFASWEKYRAPLIAQTETIAAINMADLLSVDQAKMDEVLLKCWLSARDAHVRPEHVAADGQYSKGIQLDEYFEVGGDKMLAPGTGSVGGENINCRCTLIYVEKKQ